MKNYCFLFLLSLISCAGFQQVQMEQSAPINDKLSLGRMPSSDATLINSTGIIDHFNTSDFLWESNSKKIFLDALNGKLRLHGDSVGRPEDYVYRDFNPLNFTRASAIVMSLQSEAKGLKTVNLNLIDEEGNILKLVPQNEGNEYLYSLSQKNDSSQINLKNITQINIRPVPDSGGFSGVIFIDDIKVVK